MTARHIPTHERTAYWTKCNTRGEDGDGVTARGGVPDVDEDTTRVSEGGGSEEAGEKSRDEHDFDVGREGLTEDNESVAYHGDAEDVLATDELGAWTPDCGTCDETYEE